MRDTISSTRRVTTNRSFLVLAGAAVLIAAVDLVQSGVLPRTFGLGAAPLPPLGPHVAIDAVLDQVALDGRLVQHGRVAMHDGNRLVFSGWAVDTRTRTPAAGAVVVIDGTTILERTYGEDRPDVAAAHAHPAETQSGFNDEVTAAELPRGRHRVTIGVITADRKRIELPFRDVVVDVR